MQIKRIHIEKFRSLKNVEIELGRVNVFIGPNGVGKTSILESLGVISASMFSRFDEALLMQRGIRLGTPELYKYSSKNERTSSTMSMSIDWSAIDEFKYRFTVNSVTDNRNIWRFSAESLVNLTTSKTVFGRSHRSNNFGDYQGFSIPYDRSMYGVLNDLQGSRFPTRFNWKDNDILQQLSDYAVYAPNTLILRGFQYDEAPRKFPLGIYGQKLPEVTFSLIKYLQQETDENTRELITNLFFFNSWIKSISVGAPSETVIYSNSTNSKRVVKFEDMYMRKGRNILTPNDVNEGALYSLFLACLVFHPDAPAVLSIDNFDSGMNPRVARESARIVCEAFKDSDKTILLTTHNPLVLDGLDITDDNIRLFSVDRDREGATIVNRIVISNEIRKQGTSLSDLWLTGRLGGMPNL